MPLALALTGWVVLAGVGVLGYRHFEILNGDSGLGPVRVTGDDANAERFRTYLLWNLPEPGAVPGANSLKPVTDLLGATAGGVPGAAWLQRIIDAVIAAVAIDHGYTVECKVLEAPRWDSGATVAVRVRVTRTGALVAQNVTIQPTTKQATREAAYWAAAVILSRSPRVPGWAEWDKDTSDCLAAYFQKSDQGRPDIEQLRTAVRKAPRSGLLCMELANAEALEGNLFQAFQLSLRVATIHPRYIAGRYRLAVTANLLAADPDACWGSAPEPDRETVLAALARYGPQTAALIGALRDEHAPRRTDPRVDQRADELCLFALGELDRLARDTSVSHALVKALRLRERTYWYELLRSAPGTNRYRRQFQQSIESCRPTVRIRADLPVSEAELARQYKRVADPRTLWLVAYNMACYHSVLQSQGDRSQDHIGAAVRLLETALERPGSHQLTYAWVSKDPDLDSLRGDDRFQQFHERLFGREPDPEGG